MRSLKRFITESVKTFSYTIRIAGEVEQKVMDLFKLNLNKFDVIEYSDPVTTPIQKNPDGFKNIENQPVTSFKIECRYPANDEMIRQVWQLMKQDPNQILVYSARDDYGVGAYDMWRDSERIEGNRDQSPLLLSEPGSDPGSKEANEAYGNSYLADIEKQWRTDSKTEIEYAVTPPKPDYDPFKPESIVDSKGQTSPMTKINLPPKPQTGASK